MAGVETGSENDASNHSPRARTTFAEMLRALTRPAAFSDDTLRSPNDPGHDDPGHVAEHVEVIQTHASAVILAGNRAYKLKKPNDFGFFNYSTPALRRHFCSEEVRLNARLAPHVYLGVAPVLAFADGTYRFAPACAPGATPAPGDTFDGWRVVDYAVVMLRLPENATLEACVRENNVPPKLLEDVARRMAAFHATSRADEQIAAFGALDTISHNWDENFEQMSPYIGRALDAVTFGRLRHYVDSFLRTRAALFESRVRTGCIRDCHGDLRMQHVYTMDSASGRSVSFGDDATAPVRVDSHDSLAIIDCIEFNERFRFGDVAGEVAFLTMELDSAGRPDLSRAFADAYVAETGDDALRELLPFYACYRACVRGKVLAFQLDEAEVPASQREAAQREARHLFALADHYAAGPAAPTLLLVGGLMGVGKSTLARRLKHELGWVMYSSDDIRKELAGVAPEQPQDAAFGRGIYSRDWTAKTYETLLKRAAASFADGRSVILDASWARQLDRQAAAGLAGALGVSAWFVECECSAEVALRRLAARWGSKQLPLHTDAADGSVARQPETSALDASDGRPALYVAQAAAWQPFDPVREPALVHTSIDTSASAATNAARVLDGLGIAQSICRL